MLCCAAGVAGGCGLPTEYLEKEKLKGHIVEGGSGEGSPGSGK